MGIVVTSNLALSPGSEGIDGNNPIIGIDNQITNTNVVATSADPSFPASNLANPATYLKWQALTSAAQNLDVDTGEEEPTLKDYVAIAHHNLGSIGKSATVYGFIGSSWEVLVPEFMPGTDDPIIFRFDEPIGIAQARLAVSGAGSGKAEIGAMNFGKLLVMQRRIYVGHSPITLMHRTKVTNGRSESGHFTGRIVLQQSLATGVEFTNLTPSWYRSTFEPFVRKARRLPFFWGWRPEGYPLEVGFSWLTGDVEPQNSHVNGRMRVSLQLAATDPSEDD